MVLKVLSCQIDIPPIRTAAERDRHVGRVAERIVAEAGGADLVMLPELSTVDYAPETFARLDALAEPLDGPSARVLLDVARATGAAVCFGLPRRDREHFFITQAVAGPDGAVIAYYDKMHLAQMGASAEKGVFTPGDRPSVFEWRGWRFGLAVCYDFRFPAFTGRLALDMGADAILHAGAFTHDGTFESWHPFAVTRALENQVWFLSVNRAGGEWGRSIAVPPWIGGAAGPLVMGTGEEFRTVTLDRAALEEARRDYPLRDEIR